MVASRRLYLDASALVKLILPEAETEMLIGYLADTPSTFSSRIAHVEVRRAVARVAEPGDDEHARSVLAGLQLIELDAVLAELAGSATPTSLRSLDAIHLAAALSLTPELDALITYDNHLADAARAAGLNVVSPA
jgi:predicted nucleic acid-binding protein